MRTFKLSRRVGALENGLAAETRKHLLARRDGALGLGLIIDMADYFAAAKLAMQKAKRSIHLLNWAFDPETFFLPDKDGKGPPSDTFGPFLARSRLC